MLQRIIPSTGELLPAIGLGTWQTFDVSSEKYTALQDVLTTLHSEGGRLIDSSPMYGKAEEVVGDVTAGLPQRDEFFYATKVWTQGANKGREQVDNSFRLMRREVLDLVQIHNLVDWQTHLPYLRRLKEEGKIRHIGITHYQDSSHEALADLIKAEPVDFVQFNYSLLAPNAEQSLLPLCADKGVATLVNRPFGEGSYFKQVTNKPLPDWSKELGIDNWGAFFLKAILAHPAVTCVIPATGNAQHAIANLQAGEGPLPDAQLVAKMRSYVQGR